MICKWCGNNMSPSATKCKRCGKEAPALSDCGGFYDIAPRARNAAEAPPANVSNASVPYQPAGGVPAANVTKNSKKLNLILIAAIVAVFVLVLVLFFVLLGNVNALSKEVDSLSEEVEVLKDDMKTVNNILGIDKKDKDNNKDADKTTDKNDKDDKGKGGGLVFDTISTSTTVTSPTTTNPTTTEPTTNEPPANEPPADEPSADDNSEGLNGSNLPFNPNNR